MAVQYVQYRIGRDYLDMNQNFVKNLPFIVYMKKIH